MSSTAFPPDDPDRGRAADFFTAPPVMEVEVPDDARDAMPQGKWGLASFWTGLAALVAALFPFVGLWVGIPLGVVAIVMAGVALTRLRSGQVRGKGLPFTGAGLGALAIVLGSLLSAALLTS